MYSGLMNENIKANSTANINLFDPTNKPVLQEIISELSNKGVVPQLYYQSLLEFAIFWYFLSTFFTSTMGILYYRKFKSV